MVDRTALASVAVLLPLGVAVLLACVPRPLIRAVAVGGAVATASTAGTLSALALNRPDTARTGRWIVVDPTAGLLLAVVAGVGLVSVLLSDDYLAEAAGSLVGTRRRVRVYLGVLFVFWATLLAVPLAGNLAAAWLLIEATTASSALLVGFSGKPRALEAGWKYLILTSLGLGVALLGIGLLAAGIPAGGLGGLTWQHLSDYRSGASAALTAYLLLMVGLAAKVGWAPVHNWLPDAHSEAPAPVSALLSAALLPAVLAVAWRSERALTPVIGPKHAQAVLLGFGLASLAIAVPFLWQAIAWKRLLAYSSLEHMGVIALGIGFASPLAIAGVALHIAGHATAKALGFYTATPLVAHEPRAAGHAVTGIGRTSPALGTSLGLSLGALAGLPPSPLFVSEVLIVAGGYQAGYAVTATIVVLLLSLGFLGLAHALIDVVAGKAHRGRTPVTRPGRVATMTGVGAVLLGGLTLVALTLPDSELVRALVTGPS